MSYVAVQSNIKGHPYRENGEKIMNNDFKAGIIGGLVFLGILLCFGLVENTLESSSDKKASQYSRYSYTPNYGTSKSSSYSSRSSTSGKSSSTTSSTKYSGTKSTSAGSKSTSSSSKKSNSSSSSKSSSKKKNYYNSYDDGYDSIYDDGDYDDYRYDRDSDYADGVDDAMDELEW